MRFIKRLFQPKTIYLDYASATPIDPAVFCAMEPFVKEYFENPSALYKGGVFVRSTVETAREQIANMLHAHKDEIIFTSGGTEGDQLAILGVIEYWKENNNSKVIPHIITTEIEHPAVLELCKHLEKTKQIELTCIPVQTNGVVDPNEIKKYIQPDTILVSVMHVNNEIGTIQPISEISKIIRHYKKNATNNDLQKINYPLFHTDAAQAVNYLSVDVEKLHVDLMSFNGSKIYGPKGIGVLYKRRNISFKSPFPGGGQENGFRSGTENTSGIIGIAKAVAIADSTRESESIRITKLRDFLINEVLKLDGVIVNGDLQNRIPNNINVSVSGISSELLVLEFDARGIMVSSKSACQSDDPEESYVLQAIDKDRLGSDGSIRFSLGRNTTKDDIKKTIIVFKKILKKLRKYYPAQVVSS